MELYASPNGNLLFDSFETAYHNRQLFTLKLFSFNLSHSRKSQARASFMTKPEDKSL